MAADLVSAHRAVWVVWAHPHSDSESAGPRLFLTLYCESSGAGNSTVGTRRNLPAETLPRSRARLSRAVRHRMRSGRKTCPILCIDHRSVMCGDRPALASPNQGALGPTCYKILPLETKRLTHDSRACSVESPYLAERRTAPETPAAPPFLSESAPTLALRCRSVSAEEQSRLSTFDARKRFYLQTRVL